jgi:hypothetical protein
VTFAKSGRGGLFSCRCTRSPEKVGASANLESSRAPGGGDGSEPPFHDAFFFTLGSTKDFGGISGRFSESVHQMRS